LDALGNFVWAKSFGSSSYDIGHSLAVDASGNLYTTGYFARTVDFDPGPGTANLTSVGGADAFVLKLDASGSFVWVKNFGGTGIGVGHSLAVDASGNVYTGGNFSGTADFDPGNGVASLTSEVGFDRFVSKLDASGNFVWVRTLTVNTGDSRWELTVDYLENVYAAGNLWGTKDFDPGNGTANLTSVGGADVFVSKLDASGNFVWAKSFGGIGADAVDSLTLDSSANIYIGGSFSGTVDFDPGNDVANLTSGGGADAFVSKLDASGSFLWAKSFGGTGSVSVQSLAAEADRLEGKLRGLQDYVRAVAP
jgi:DNA primase